MSSQILNSSLVASETVFIGDAVGSPFTLVIQVGGAFVTVEFRVDIPKNELWQILHIGAVLNVSDVETDISVVGANGTLRPLSVTGGPQTPTSTFPLAISLDSAASPAGAFFFSSSSFLNPMSPNRRISMLITLSNTGGVNESVFSGNMTLEIQRFRLGTDSTITTLQTERAVSDMLNARLLGR